MIARHAPLAGAVVLITLLGYFFFPGHTYLQQDSQIYVPILEHLWDSTVLANDPIAVRHHVTFTVYDEVALAVRRCAGLGFEEILVSDQLLFRALGILGVYLIAMSLQLSRRAALLVAVVYALGATIAGPAVLSVEYEPKPRSSALPLIILAAGCIAHGRHLAGGVAASLAFLYHPPTVYPFWSVYFCLVLWPSRPEVMKRRLLGLVPLAVAAALLFLLSRLQAGGPEPQPFLGRIDPELEQLQRMRASYEWVSSWISGWIGHYVFLWAVSVVALLRLRRLVSVDLRFFLAGLPLVGILSVPLSYLVLEQWKWALMTKFQPSRALLFVSVVAAVSAAAACLRAARSNKLLEAFAWGAIAFAIPVQARVSELLLPDMTDPLIRRRVAVVLALVLLAAGAAWLETRRRKRGWIVWSAAVVAPFLLIPYCGKVENYTTLHHRELDELSAWARLHTPKEAVFLFPDAGKARHPGVFRSRALRAVYVDWKGGGQVNMVKAFGQEWWNRWQQTMAPGFNPGRLERYASLGIDYIVVQPSSRIPEREPVFENEKYLVYRLG